MIRLNDLESKGMRVGCGKIALEGEAVNFCNQMRSAQKFCFDELTLNKCGMR